MISAKAIRWSESQQYGFVTGRVRALETLLLDRVMYERLIRAEGVEEFVALLNTTRYGDFLRLVTEGDVREALSLSREENFN
ncbi:MAG: V-type ATPase subunit, partial [candidate division WOR-3 bacterium]